MCHGGGSKNNFMKLALSCYVYMVFRIVWKALLFSELCHWPNICASVLTY